MPVRRFAICEFAGAGESCELIASGNTAVEIHAALAVAGPDLVVDVASQDLPEAGLLDEDPTRGRSSFSVPV